MSAPGLSVVLSFRNEADVIPELISRLAKSLEGAGIDYELIFVNDASTDGSLALLEALRARDPRVKILNMSRRFGVAPCVMAGMQFARGDAVVYMDTDLQDPPELIPTLVTRWREGADVVYTVRTSRQGESVWKMRVTRAAYRAIQLASDIELPIEAGDFKLLSRRVVDHLIALGEQDLYVRGLVTWMGFRQVAVPYERQPRGAGEAHFPLLRSWGPISSFVAGVTSFSHAPLIAFLLLGLAGVALSMLALALLLLAGVVGAAASSIAWLVAFGLLLWSTLALGIGVIGLYLARIHREVLGRPRYIVESAIGFDEPS
ncbi:MAG: glycosyltransferase family 2 protein [Proteobacteria bacterium]|nr:glycosyltransferase family 2 protein [Pseudomonadota bacterium]